jgi:hypothetical protein
LLVFGYEKCAHQKCIPDQGKVFPSKNDFALKNKKMLIQVENLLNSDKPILHPGQNSGQ